MRYGNFQFFKVAIHEMNIQKEPAHGNIEITDNVNRLKLILLHVTRKWNMKIMTTKLLTLTQEFNEFDGRFLYI